MKVLLVDDDRDFAAALAERLELRGFEARAVYSGAGALAALEGFDAQVVVLDVEMPELGGIETLGLIKQRRPGVEVILLTGHASVDAALQGLDNQAFDYLIKPVPIAELVRLIGEASPHIS